MIIVPVVAPRQGLIPPKTTNRYVWPKVSYVIYEQDGTVIGRGSGAIGYAEDRIAAGERLLIAEDNVPADVWVDPATKTLYLKAENPATLQGMTLSNLPKPCRLQIDGQEYEVKDGTAELSFNLPGTYQVTVLSVAYLTKVFEVVYG